MLPNIAGRAYSCYFKYDPYMDQVVFEHSFSPKRRDLYNGYIGKCKETGIKIKVGKNFYAGITRSTIYIPRNHFSRVTVQDNFSTKFGFNGSIEDVICWANKVTTALTRWSSGDVEDEEAAREGERRAVISYLKQNKGNVPLKFNVSDARLNVKLSDIKDLVPFVYRHKTATKVEDFSTVDIDTLVFSLLVLCHDYSSVNSLTRSTETYSGRRRSSIDLYRHVLYYRKDFSVFDVMAALYRLTKDRILSTNYCGDVHRRVFRINISNSSEGIVADEYGLYFPAWEKINLSTP